MASSSKSELIEQILRLQIQSLRIFRADKPEAWLTLNLSIAQLKSLFFIDFKGETNFKSLAAALGVSPSNVTGIIDRLIEHGMVNREYNRLNRREQRLKLTSQGEELIRKLKESIGLRHSHLLEKLDIKDLAALEQGLKALITASRQDQDADASKTSNKGLS